MGTLLLFAGRSFIGRKLAEVLRRRGLHAISTVRGTATDTATETCDLTDTDQVAALVERVRPQGVVQCAGVTHGNDVARQYAVHVLGTLNVLQAVARYVPAATVVLVGSAAEYGPVSPADFPIGEDQASAPTTFFGTSKLAQTELARAAAAEWSLRVITVRPFNVIGPGLPDHYFLAALATRLRHARCQGEGRSFPVSNLEATRDFIDVRDVVAALGELVLHRQPPAGQMEIFNVASGVETSLRSVSAYLGQLAGGLYPAAGPAIASRGGVHRSCGDSSRLRRAIGWVPRYPWQQSVSDFWNETADAAPRLRTG
jgi:GDP-4-dehydro-6-deoxy-D-mannose reductase